MMICSSFYLINTTILLSIYYYDLKEYIKGLLIQPPLHYQLALNLLNITAAGSVRCKHEERAKYKMLSHAGTLVSSPF